LLLGFSASLRSLFLISLLFGSDRPLSFFEQGSAFGRSSERQLEPFYRFFLFFKVRGGGEVNEQQGR
jgi:hypothetical protein